MILQDFYGTLDIGLKMAANFNYRIIGELTGLDQIQTFIDNADVSTTPARHYRQRQVQAVADTEEALGVGDVTTIELILLSCISNDVDIDTSFNASFNAEITVNEGEFAVFKPTGTVYIKNNDAAEVVTVVYLIIGSA